METIKADQEANKFAAVIEDTAKTVYYKYQLKGQSQPISGTYTTCNPKQKRALAFINDKHNTLANARALLGVTRNSSRKEINSAYRNLAREVHPDKNPNNVAKAEEYFINITNAKKLLLANQEGERTTPHF